VTASKVDTHTEYFLAIHIIVRSAIFDLQDGKLGKNIIKLLFVVIRRQRVAVDRLERHSGCFVLFLSLVVFLLSSATALVANKDYYYYIGLCR